MTQPSLARLASEEKPSNIESWLGTRFNSQLTVVCDEWLWTYVFCAAKMGNCHTVGPNEALVVSGNVNGFWTMLSASRAPFPVSSGMANGDEPVK